MPSKKFIIIFLAILLAGAGFFWLFKDRSLGEDNKIVFEKEGSLISGLFQQDKRDSDSDGLADWEEALWKTDPNNPDSDNDDTLDGEEVKKGRNPLKPGPDDLYSPESFPQEATPVSQKLNETEELSRDFISQYLGYKWENESALSQEEKDKIVDSLLGGIDFSVPTPAYTLNDIKVLPDNSQESLKNYASQLETIFSRYANPPPAMEVYIFKEMIEKEDESLVAELDKSVATYEGLKKDCLNLAAPSEIKNSHFKLINSLALLKSISEKFRDYFNDPLGAFTALKQYQSAATGAVNSVTEIRNYLKGKGIPFKL